MLDQTLSNEQVPCPKCGSVNDLTANMPVSAMSLACSRCGSPLETEARAG